MNQSEKASSKFDIYALPNLKLKVYWAIDHLTSSKKDRFTPAEIANFLIEKAGFNTTSKAVWNALNKNKSACNKNRQGYKLMQEGKNQLLAHFTSQNVVLVDANKPFSAKNFTLKEVLGSSYKELAVCDPYVDLHTLDIIFKNFKKNVPIRVLTYTVTDKPPGTFKRQLQALNKEGFNVEVRVYMSNVLHDRYIMSNKHFWFSGNSLNHLGEKESLLVLLGEDVRQAMLSVHNSRWKTATAV